MGLLVVKRYSIQRRQSRLVLPGSPSEIDDEVKDFVFVSMTVNASVNESSVSILLQHHEGYSAILSFGGVEGLRLECDDSPPLGWRQGPSFNLAELNNGVFEFVVGPYSLEFTAADATVTWPEPDSALP